MLAPIILFVYKRPWHTQRTLDALKNNHLSKSSFLFIFSDYCQYPEDKEAVLNVRKIINNLKGFKDISIIEKNNHEGLASSIINGVSYVFAKFSKAIILEDDLLTSVNFLQFMNQGLDFYRVDKRIFSISGYNYPIVIPSDYKYPVYLSYRASSWGWATWKDRWNKADWQVKDYDKFKNDQNAQLLFNKGGEDLTDMLDYQMRGYIDSWAIRWCYTHFKNHAFCLHPTVSKVRNIGLDGTGTHKTRRKIDPLFDTGREILILNHNLKIDDEIINNFSLYFKKGIKGKTVDFLKKNFFRMSNLNDWLRSSSKIYILS